MTDLNRHVGPLRVIRETQRVLERQQDVQEALLTAAAAELERLRRTAANSTEIRRQVRRVAALKAARGRLAARRTAALERGVSQRAAIARTLRLDTLVAGLDADIPVALLPVRLETRFTASARSLKVRIYPDDLHVDSHELALTESELEAGKAYWIQVFSASGDVDAERSAWKTLVEELDATRGAWVARATTPVNLTDVPTPVAPTFGEVALKGAEWTRAPRVRVLPERWLVVGYQRGQEVFRRFSRPVSDHLEFGPAPDPSMDGQPDTVAPLADGGPGLNITPGMLWMVDFAEAERAGMAVTISDSNLRPGHQLASGLDRLVVLGVDWRLDPDEGAAELATLLEAHRHTEGFALLRQGTPTNNTGAGRSAFDSRESVLTQALDPRRPDPSLGVGTNGRVLAAALGVPADSFDRDPGANIAEQAGAGHMNSALWEATMGYTCKHMLKPAVTPAGMSMARQHFVDLVRGRGPLPTFRIGPQPYGVLPVLPPQQWRPSEASKSKSRLFSLLCTLRAFWTHAAGQVPRMGRSAQDPDQDLLRIMEATPRSRSVRSRDVVGPLTVANSRGLTGTGQAQALMGKSVLEMLGVKAKAKIADLTLTTQHRRLTFPWVTDKPLSETDRLTPNYISSLAKTLRTIGGVPSLVAGRLIRSNTLLFQLLRQAGLIEVGAASRKLIDNARVSMGVVGARLPKVGAADDEPEFVDVEASGTHTLRRISELKVRAISGRQTMSNHLASTRLSGAATARFRQYLTNLRALAKLPTAELQRLFAETLDLCSHRLDAWFTSFATERLAEHRKQTSGGLYLGAYGWVEDLKRDRAPDSAGFVHAPSIPHAATAAVLRSGHLTHGGAASEAMSIDLSSARVRRALHVLDGIRQGQPLGALLGYRFERSIRERDVALAQYILPLRRVAPLPTTGTGPDGPGPLEAIEARDVVDGVKLLKKWKKNPTGFFANDADLPNPGHAHQRALQAELEELDQVLDAVGDLMVSEGVFQIAQGNSERAGAALAALDRQAPPPEPEVVRSPRSGRHLSHRVFLVLQDDQLPAPWAGHTDVRGTAAPRVNAWLASILRDPGSVRFAVDLLDDDGALLATAAGSPLAPIELTLADLGISPLSAVLDCASGSASQPTTLEERLAIHVRLGLSVAENQAAKSLRVRRDALLVWPSDTITLGALQELTRAVIDIISVEHSLDAQDLDQPDDQPGTGIDQADLASRADKVSEALGASRVRLDAAFQNSNPTPAGLRKALLDASEFSGAVPLSDGRGEEGKAALKEQIEQVLRDVDRRLGALNELAAGFDATKADEEATVDHQKARISTALGRAFPVLPRFTPGNSAELAASLSDKNSLVGGDSMVVSTWFSKVAKVRPRSEALGRVWQYADALSGSMATMEAAQLPHVPGDRWLARPVLSNTEPPQGDLSLVFLAPSGVSPSAPLAGVVVDQWTETVPSTSETTGVSFHYDAPGARAPQAVLLAVRPDPGVDKWSLNGLIETVNEGLDLAHIRVVDLDMLPFLPRFLPGIYLARNQREDTFTLDLGVLEDAERKLHNLDPF